jgi:hypothetical protein
VNLSIASQFFGVILFDNRSSPPHRNNDPYGGFNTHFNPSMAIIIFVLSSSFFFLGFLADSKS